jgi:hypothetical protein
LTANGWPWRNRTFPPAADITEEIALVFVGRGDFDFHDRFEQNRMRLFEGVFERKNADRLERQFPVRKSTASVMTGSHCSIAR